MENCLRSLYQPILVAQILDQREMGVGGENDQIVGDGNRGDLNVDGGNGATNSLEVCLNLTKRFGCGGIEFGVQESGQELTERLFVGRNSNALMHHKPQLADRRKA